MATFMEAMQAARDGKRVRPTGGFWCHWYAECLRIVDSAPAGITNSIFGEWEIETPPPKRYSFVEAVALMEQGKTMISPNGMRTKLRSTLLANENNGPKMLLLEEINGLWTEEVQ
jgi:hypothetical protein